MSVQEKKPSPTRNFWLVPYNGVWKSLSFYWDTYGGVKALISSPYLHISLLITVVCYPFSPGDSWHKLILSVIPNLLGFSLGAYAILLAFGDELFRKIMSGKTSDGKSSPFMMVNGAFTHFIVIQVLTIITAIIGASLGLKGGFFGLIGFLLLVYSLFTAVAAAFAILNMAKWFNEYLSRKTGKKEISSEDSQAKNH